MKSLYDVFEKMGYSKSKLVCAIVDTVLLAVLILGTVTEKDVVALLVALIAGICVRSIMVEVYPEHEDSKRKFRYQYLFGFAVAAAMLAIKRIFDIEIMYALIIFWVLLVLVDFAGYFKAREREAI